MFLRFSASSGASITFFSLTATLLKRLSALSASSRRLALSFTSAVALSARLATERLA